MNHYPVQKAPHQKADELVEPLTRRELEILALLAANRSNAEIAESLSLALSSVKWYAQQIYTKLGVDNRRQAVAKGRDLGLLETPRHPDSSAPGLPTGTVTFLFTEIEGSTKLWEQMPQAMQAAVAQHHAILREAIEANHGQVFQVIGDAFQAAFRLASEGLCAALAVQRTLRDARWGPTGALKVRMGLHTGPAELDGGPDAPYQVGHTLTRAALVMSDAHGGQVLLSQEAAYLVECELPDGVTLLDLGQHRLKGMQRLEHLYQVVAADLPQQFPPLATEISHPHNLPAQLTSFIGRGKEIAALRELFLIRGARLLTLTGSGGTGKTRLALRTAEPLLEAFPQGIWLVQLAPLSDPQLVPRAVAEVLGVSEDPQRNIAQGLAAFLRDRQTLLILDNCEHVVGEASALAGQLLQTCPQLRILATSREILGVEGEVPFRCPSLSLPKGTPTAGSLVEYEAARLFVERAQTVSPGFALTEDNAPTIARICQRLDGIPLAIELAAARTRMLSLDQIAARLDHAFRLLTGGSRSVLPRHQTLKALIDWSYNLLSPEERILLLRLSVFSGGWSLEAAESVCADREKTDGQGGILLLPEQILDLLGQQIDKSLIQIDQEQAEEAPLQTEVRYRMLETVRQYAHERLSESGGAEELRDRHLDYFLSLSSQAEPHLRVTGARGWLDLLDREMDNLRLALEWSLSVSLEKGLRIAAALWWFWHVRNHRPEGVEWLERLLAADDLCSTERPRAQADRIARGKALNAQSYLAGRFPPGDRGLARERALNSKAIFDELGAAFQRDSAIALWNMAETRQDLLACRQLFQTIGERFYLAECDMDLAEIAGEHGDYDQEYRYAQESLALREEIGDLDGAGYILYQLSTLELIRGKPAIALELAHRSTNCFESVGNREVIIISLLALHMAALVQGDYRQASELIEKEITLGKDLSSWMVLITAHSHYAFAAWARQEYAQAIQHAEEALEMAREVPFSWKKTALYALGRVALSQGDYPRSREYLVSLFTPVLYPYDKFINDFRAFHALGVLATVQGQPRRAVVLFGAEEALCGWTLNILCPAERSEYEQALATAGVALGEADFAAAWEEGRALTRNQARQYAREEY